MYSQDNVLNPVFKEITYIFPQSLQSVELLQDEATSHAFKSTTKFLEKMAKDRY